MATVCEICGDIGFEQLLLSCDDCKGATHQYCLAKIIFDASVLKGWWCNECQPRNGEVAYKGSLQEVPNQRQPSHVHSDSGLCQPSSTGLESTREAGLSGNYKNKSCESKSRSRRIINSSRQHVETQRDINENFTGDFVFEKPKKRVRFKLDNEENNDFRSQNMAANEPQPSTLQEIDVDRTMLSSANMDVLPKASDCRPSEHTKIESLKNSCATPVLTGENQTESSRLVSQDHSSHFSETTPKPTLVLEVSDTDMELPDAVQTCVQDNLMKRKWPILLEEDKEEAAEMQPEDFNHRSLECDGAMSNHRIGTEDCVEEVVLSSDSNGQNLQNGNRPVKNQTCVKLDITLPVKKTRCTKMNEEVVIGTDNGKCALSDVSSLTSQTVVEKDQRCHIYSKPIDNPIWRGELKISNKVSVMLAAHRSTKACEIVWELSQSMQRVIEVTRLPRLEAWPKSWVTSGPTDDNIALYFFPPSTRTNEKLDSLVEEIIESDLMLKAVVGIAELLIFPSNMLPEQYHVHQGKHYLWGVFKSREDGSSKDVLVEEHDGSESATEEREIQEHHSIDQQYEVHCESSDGETSVVKHSKNESDKNVLVEERDGSESATEEGEIQEHHSMDQQYEVQCESSEGKTSVVKHAVHVEAQEEAMETDMRGGICSPGSSLFSVNPNPPKDKQDLTKPSVDSGPAAATTKSNDSAEHKAVPAATKLFGFVAARTPRAQQLIQEMVGEGAFLFSVPEETAATVLTVGNHAGVGLHLTPDSEDPPTQEHRQFIDFVSMDHDDCCEASEACLELFPVRQEHIGWISRAGASKDIDLDLHVSVRSRGTSPLL